MGYPMIYTVGYLSPASGRRETPKSCHTTRTKHHHIEWCVLWPPIPACTHTHSKTRSNSTSTITHHPNITGQPHDPPPPLRDPGDLGTMATLWPIQQLPRRQPWSTSDHCPLPSPFLLRRGERSIFYHTEQWSAREREREGERGARERVRERDWGLHWAERLKQAGQLTRGALCVCVYHNEEPYFCYFGELASRHVCNSVFRCGFVCALFTSVCVCVCTSSSSKWNSSWM